MSEPAASSLAGSAFHGALPGRYVDLVRDGYRHPIGKKSNRAYQDLIRVAMSAMQHGWNRADWLIFMRDPRNRLWGQVHERYPQPDRVLLSAWDKAGQVVARSPAPSGEQVVALLIEVQQRSTSDAALTADELAVINFALAVGHRQCTWRVAVPWRAVVASTGVSEAKVKAILGSGASGYLELVQHGLPGDRRRANLYRLQHPISPGIGQFYGMSDGSTSGVSGEVRSEAG